MVLFTLCIALSISGTLLLLKRKSFHCPAFNHVILSQALLTFTEFLLAYFTPMIWVIAFFSITALYAIAVCLGFLYTIRQRCTDGTKYLPYVFPEYSALTLIIVLAFKIVFNLSYEDISILLMCLSPAMSYFAVLLLLYHHTPGGFHLLMSRLPFTKEHALKSEFNQIYDQSIAEVFGSRPSLNLSEKTRKMEAVLTRLTLIAADSNKGKALKILNISRSTLYRKIKACE